MTELIGQGVWVEIHTVLLEPGERAPQVPDDTARIPFEMRVKGFLVEQAALGEPAEIITATGRRLRGKLSEVNPAYRHGFGPPIPELSTVGRELRCFMGQQKSGNDSH